MSSIYINGNDSYFYSNKIKVFPCAYRNNTYDATARLNTEYNFTHLPHTVDKASYIIEFTEEKLICVIQGYYFEIELGTGDYTTLQNKYLNICVASPNSVGSIEGPHLCSWDSSDSVEAILDGKPEGSDYYIFKGLKIGEGALSNGSYQCYALKLDASAKLPIMANKIENIIKNKDSVENGTGKPISQEFTTETLSATTSISTPSLNVASGQLIANSDDNIIANVPVTINNTLEVKTGNTSVLKAESTKVTINKPTDITGTTEIKKSSSGAMDGNLKVAGTVGITGKTTIGTDSAKTDIENNKITTSEIIADKINVKKIADTDTYHLIINKEQNNIIEIKNNKNNPIFSVNTDSGVTYAKQINADNINAIVEGTINDAKKAEKVTTYIGDISISSIFETNSSVVRKASSLTAASSTGSAGKIIITGNTNGTVDALIPEKTTGRTYNIGSSDKTFDNIYATTFHGNLDGNASTASTASTAGEFKIAASIKLTGDVISDTVSSTHGWTIKTTINNGAVTKDKILDGAVTTEKILKGNVTNAKLANSSITIGSNIVELGDSIGTSDKPFTESLYFSKLTVNEAPTELNDAVRKTELDNTFWLSGGVLIQSNTDLNDLKTVGNYYALANTNTHNRPTNADSAFTLKVTSLVEGTFIQQQLCDVSGKAYTRTFTSATSWSEWSLVLTSEAAKTIGSVSKPVYLADGQLTACKYAYTVTNALPSELQADTIYFITED